MVGATTTLSPASDSPIRSSVGNQKWARPLEHELRPSLAKDPCPCVGIRPGVTEATTSRNLAAFLRNRARPTVAQTSQ
jgi:hypothetical protein